ncbi:Nif3-like dinuclear metal center hexameric protein [Tenacibaculum sp. 1_MG-2023]|uniref:Nif3-like dinuclear metal center hexameric protein n=1 Tax=Tenacibaculum sp. 1_MG-2023 TaxID=3062653 RepID=UPI0026E1435B|nr:Nif3-like dinuclear metal center hexameric protein [Tenacibaculum sp. 1_MG-2023]MDO6600908.1 Nif3-like dinuclear metal center hexameric protein [Tenacibaculum sp. 1_MG-2023]
MKIKDITNYLEELAPLSYAEDFDNVGLLVGNYATEVTGVLVTLDTLEETVDEAIAKNCNLIVSFHPIIFGGLKKLNGNNYVERVVLKAIKNDIAIYATHTALDNTHLGVSAKMCEVLGIENPQVLIPKETFSDKNIGMGMIGELPSAITEDAFLKLVKNNFKTDCVRHSNKLDKKIKKVAVLGGSGSFAIKNAIQQKADAYVSADFKYHEFFKAENKILLTDVGHYESEQFTKNLLVEYLSKKFTKFAVILSEKSTNPIYYF